MRRATRFAVLAFAISTVICLVAQAAEGEKAPAVHRALLIGVNDYKANDQPPPSGGGAWIPADLRGAINDLEKMQAVLTSRYGFEAGQIRLLADRQATRAAILEAMREIVSASGPDDVVYIHFSGHGSQAPDTDGDEKDDELDETILSYDARTGDVPDITDDELGEILSGLKTKNALIVLDSCHSGTATRAISPIRTRMVAADPRAKLYVRKKVSTRSVGPAGPAAEYVLMTGAASHQSALDGPIDGRFYGFFSYALGKALVNAPAQATPRAVHASVLKEFERLAADFGLIGMPSPQVEGPSALTERSVFGAAGLPNDARSKQARLAWAEVRTATDGAAILVSAVPLGAQMGATWAIYPPGATEFLPGTALATATVTGTIGDDAIASVEPANPPLPAGCRAVAVAPPPASDRISIQFDRVQPEMRAGLERELSRLSPEAQFVGKDEFARFIIDVEGGVVRVFGAGGLQEVASFPAGSAESAAEKVAAELTRSSAASGLLSLDNPASALRLDVRVVPSGADGATRAIKVVAAADAPSYRMRGRGVPRSAENSLMLELEVSEASYVTVVDVDTEGGINILFPNTQMKDGFYPDGFIPAEGPVRLPDSLQRANRAGFFWDYGPPAGLDTVRVFAMTDLESAQKLRAHIASMKSTPATRGQAAVHTRGAAKPKAPRATFNDLARELAGNVAARGIAVVADEPEPEAAAPRAVHVQPSGPDWTATSLTLVVEK